MTPQQVEELKDLVHRHPKHAASTKLERIAQLERMMDFYLSKAEVAPKKQSMMFHAFASTLDYSINTIKLYDQITNSLTEIVGK